MKQHPFGNVGHYFVLAMVAIAGVLDREKVISDQLHGTIQVAIGTMGLGWVTAILHNSWVQRAEAAIAAAAKGADATSALLAKVSTAVKDVLAAVNSTGGAS